LFCLISLICPLYPSLYFITQQEAILKNVEACKGLAAITRTSLGPNGMNKLVVNHLEKLFITSDAATIVQELEVVHPAAKMLARAALMQVQEVGDGGNFVVTFAGELLSCAESMLRIGVHPSEIVEGYKKASERAYNELESICCYTLKDARIEADLTKALLPVLASKQFGNEAFLAKLVAQACLSVMPPAPKAPSISVDNVRVAKLIGGTLSDSTLVKGVVVQRDVEGSIRKVEKAKIAVFGCSIEASSSETKGTVVIHNADELKAYNKGEEKMMEDAIKAVADSGAKVVVAGGGISEIAMHFIEKYSMMAIKVVSKFELRRLCKAVNATAMVRVGAPAPGELGYADIVEVQELSSRNVTVFKQHDDDSAVTTIVLRGATMNLLDDIERAVDDAVNVAKVLCKDGRMLPGAGAAEIELAHKLNRFAETTPGLEQYAIAKYGEALEAFPRTLAENSGQAERDVITALYAAHAAGKSTVGVDIEGNQTLDAAASGILDSFAVKLSALRLASEAAITVLRVDQIIMSKQAGGPKPRQPGAPDED
jgi:T-complex protein 1 subunit theta